MAVMRRYTVRVIDMRTLQERDVPMLAVSPDAAWQGVRALQDVPAEFALRRVTETAAQTQAPVRAQQRVRPVIRLK